MKVSLQFIFSILSQVDLVPMARSKCLTAHFHADTRFTFSKKLLTPFLDFNKTFLISLMSLFIKSASLLRCQLKHGVCV